MERVWKEESYLRINQRLKNKIRSTSEHGAQVWPTFLFFFYDIYHNPELFLR